METKKGFEKKFQEVCKNYMLDANMFASSILDVMECLSDNMSFNTYRHVADVGSSKIHIESAIYSMMSYFVSVEFCDRLDRFIVVPTKTDDEIAEWKQFLQSIAV